MRVPVRVKNNNCVSSLQVQTKTSSTSAQDKQEVVWVGFIEDFQQLSSVFWLGHSIKTQVGQLYNFKVTLQWYEHYLNQILLNPNTFSSSICRYINTLYLKKLKEISDNQIRCTQRGWVRQCLLVVMRDTMLTFVDEEILQDVKKWGHLTEQQTSMTSDLQFGKNSVKQLKLATCSP